MESVEKKRPHWRDDRIILHFDYDCFYAQVVENQQPALKSLPLGIKQKSILATCNYEARRRGVKKLSLISEARKLCPELVVVEGEDLSPFRDVSKRLYSLLRTYSWNKKVERLGLDEVFLDVTDIIAYNVPLLNRNDLRNSFFCLSQEDPEQGFAFDASAIAGCVSGSYRGKDGLGSIMYVRLLLASHLARFLRLKVEEEGYTSACGISTNKVLSKLAGNKNKPRNQTTLLAFDGGDVLQFMDPHGLRKVPGIGSKITYVLESHVLGHEAKTDTYTSGSSVTVGEARTREDMSPPLLEKLLGGPGAEKGIGDKVWALLHGVDDTEVKAASNVPTQISIEDTYQGLNEPSEIARELRALSMSLLRRMHVDLTEDDENASPPGRQRWIAHPRTLRLTTRPKTSAAEGKPYGFGRASRSQPLPGFILGLSASNEELAGRLMTECLLPMFYKLNPEQRGWNIGLLNICVANIALSGTDDAAGSGRDISVMFKRQDEVLRDFRVYDDQPVEEKAAVKEDVTMSEEPVSEDDGLADSEPWTSSDGSEACPRCGHHIPAFAITAHTRYHMLED